MQPPALYVSSCNTLLKELTHSDLQSTVMPAVHKSLLRNPEAVLSALAGLAAGSALDLSPYLSELAKLLQGQLHLMSGSQFLIQRKMTNYNYYQ